MSNLKAFPARLAAVVLLLVFGLYVALEDRSVALQRAEEGASLAVLEEVAAENGADSAASHAAFSRARFAESLAREQVRRICPCTLASGYGLGAECRYP